MNAAVELDAIKKEAEANETSKPKRQRIRKQKQYELIRIVKPS